jgi:2,4-dienoyl-CoA reductase-like NADH-dependent reductase (Old Yellow Enzyme family)
MSDLLFTPAQLGSLTIKNRLVRSATGEGMALPDGSITDDQAAFYRRLADGGVRLIISGHTYVHPLGKASRGMTGLYKDDQISMLRKLTDSVHEAGSTIAVQLNHAGRQTEPLLIGRETPLAPSALARPNSRIVPKEMTEADIEEAIQAFAEASRRAVEAGYDAIQIHSAHGYLISEFNSPYANQRTDRWGGSPENRRRLLLEVYRRVRATVGEGVPVFVKLNGEDFIEGGLMPVESAGIAEALEAEGIDAIEVSAGFAETAHLIVRKDISKPEEEAYLLPLARTIRQAVSVPVMIVGGLRSRDVMERMLSEEQMTFVSLCRPFIRQPDLAKKMEAGELDRVTCTSCGRCGRNEEGWLACALDDDVVS